MRGHHGLTQRRSMAGLFLCGFLSRSGPRSLSFKRFSLKTRPSRECRCILSPAAVIQSISYAPKNDGDVPAPLVGMAVRV